MPQKEPLSEKAIPKNWNSRKTNKDPRDRMKKSPIIENITTLGINQNKYERSAELFRFLILKNCPALQHWKTYPSRKTRSNALEGSKAEGKGEWTLKFKKKKKERKREKRACSQQLHVFHFPSLNHWTTVSPLSNIFWNSWSFVTCWILLGN